MARTSTWRQPLSATRALNMLSAFDVSDALPITSPLSQMIGDGDVLAHRSAPTAPATYDPSPRYKRKFHRYLRQRGRPPYSSALGLGPCKATKARLTLQRPLVFPRLTSDRSRHRELRRKSQLDHVL